MYSGCWGEWGGRVRGGEERGNEEEEKKKKDNQQAGATKAGIHDLISLFIVGRERNERPTGGQKYR